MAYLYVVTGCPGFAAKDCRAIFLRFMVINSRAAKEVDALGGTLFIKGSLCMPSLDFKGKQFVYAHHLSVPFRQLDTVASGIAG